MFLTSPNLHPVRWRQPAPKGLISPGPITIPKPPTAGQWKFFNQIRIYLKPKIQFFQEQIYASFAKPLPPSGTYQLVLSLLLPAFCGMMLRKRYGMFFMLDLVADSGIIMLRKPINGVGQRLLAK